MDHELLHKHVNLSFLNGHMWCRTSGIVSLPLWCLAKIAIGKTKSVFPAIAMHMKKSSWDWKYEMTYDLINLLDPTANKYNKANKCIIIHKKLSFDLHAYRNPSVAQFCPTHTYGLVRVSVWNEICYHFYPSPSPNATIIFRDIPKNTD